MSSSIQLEFDYDCLSCSSQFLFFFFLLIRPELKLIFKKYFKPPTCFYLFSKLDKLSKSKNDGMLDRTKDNAGQTVKDQAYTCLFIILGRNPTTKINHHTIVEH